MRIAMIVALWLIPTLVHAGPISFRDDIVPILTKLNCNSGGCHGKASGQNGFKLSLFGFEPDDDYEYLVKEARGRRLFPAAPRQSLLLQKATAQVPHAGGRKLDIDSPFYTTLEQWIAAGSPADRKDAAAVTHIRITPGEQVIARNGNITLTVTAYYADGRERDVTALTQLDCNDAEMALVQADGQVRVQNRPGSFAIMARYQSHVAVFRGIVPLGGEAVALPAPANFVDEHIRTQWSKLGLTPSPLADDGTMIRRITLDIAGRLPTLDEVNAYLADTDPQKYPKLVERLLASDDYADHFAMKWSALLRNRRKTDKDDPKPTFAFHTWIREQLRTNRPYDQFVREILTASGAEVENPPVIWYREVREASAQMEDVAQLFLGQRIGCAKCHHHPQEKWSQQDYYGMVAFFEQVSIKDPPPPKKPKKGEPEIPREPFTVAHKAGVAKSSHPRTKRSILPTGLGASPLTIPAEVDPRTQLADWMTHRDNPFFARAIVNRYWKHFHGRGLIDPEDDLRATNPPTNPDLLDALARSFIESKYDLKQLVRTICMARVYQLSAVPTPGNASDVQNYARYQPKRLTAEVLLDAIDAVTLTKPKFKNVPDGTRAVQLPDNQVDSYFLSVFGRPDGASACECERRNDPTLAQCLHLFNSKEMIDKVRAGRAPTLVKDKRPHSERITELYLLALARRPTPTELETLESYITKKSDAQTAYEDIIWALLNTKEFLYNH